MLVLGVAAAIFYRESLLSRALVGQAAPGFALPELQGGEVRLEDLRGQVVLINFWATWCEPCRTEIPELQKFADRYRGRVTLLGINLREPPDTIELFRSQYGVRYPILLDRQGRVADRYRLKAVPESWFVDPSGVARIYHQGPLTFEQMEAGYRLTLSEPGHGAARHPSEPGQAVARHSIEVRQAGSR